MNIEIGSEVRTRDGYQAGHVHRVVVDLEQQAVVSIVVLKGRLLPRDILVPLDFIQEARPERVTLTVDQGELAHLPDFAYDSFFTPPPTWAFPIVIPGGVVYIPVSQRQRLATSQEDVAAGTRVLATDGELGSVDRIEAEASGHLDAFWVRPTSGGPDLRVPVEWVASLDDDGAHLAASRQEVAERLAHESEARRQA